MARFSFYDVFISVLSLVTYVADIGTDIWLIVYFFATGYPIWGALTLGFVTLATLVMEVFSFHWHVTDRTVTPKIFIIHILFLAPIYRYISVIRKGLKSRRTGKQEDIDNAFREVNDVCILRLFETFLEAAPQLVLQLYIILSDLKNSPYAVVVSSVFSLLSLAWAVTAYTDALHLAYKKLYKRTTTSLATHFLWQTGMISSRVFAIVLFAVAFKAFVAIPLVLHCVIMILWVLLIKPEFGATRCERNLFIIISSLIHVFCFLNLKDGASRGRMLFFYGVTLIENTAFVTLWYFFKDSSPNWLIIVAFVVVFGGFAIGVASMLFYYGCCHPSGPAPIPPLKPEFHLPPARQEPKDQLTKPRLPMFDISSTSARINQWLNASLDLSKEGLVEIPNDNVDNPKPYTDDPTSGSFNKGGSDPNFVSLRSPRNDSDMNGTPASLNGTHPLSDSGVHILSPSSRKQNNKNRSPLYAVEDRLDQTTLCQSACYQQEPTLSDRSLVEMFSRCKLDPSFISTGSLNDSGVFQSRIGDSSCQSRQGDSSGTSGYRTQMSATSPGYMSMSNTSCGQASNVHRVQPDTLGSGNSLHSQCNYMNYSDQNVSDLNPVKISPLDPSKLWAEFNERLNYRQNQSGSDTAINESMRSNGTIIKVVPDHLRGITSLSVSYNCLSDPNLSSSEQQYHSLPLGKRPDISNKSINSSQGVSFSNLSLQLPDSSYSTRSRLKRSLSPDGGGSYGDIQNQRDTSGNREGNSLTDKQSTYLSDQGLAASDRGLSSSGSVVERSHRSLTSSGFQSEESNMSELSPSHIPGHQHNRNLYQQSTPILENEITTIHSLPSTIRTKRVSLDQDVNFPNSSSLDTPPYAGDTWRQGNRMAPTSSLFTSDKTDFTDSLPPLTVRSRSTSSDGSSRAGRFFKDPSLEDDKNISDLSSEQSQGSLRSLNSIPRSEDSIPVERSSLSAMISNMSSSYVGTNASDSLYLEPKHNSLDRSVPSEAVYGGSDESRSSMYAGNTPPLYVNLDRLNSDNQMSRSESTSSTGSESKKGSRSRLNDQERLTYLSASPTEQQKLMELLAEMKSVSDGGSSGVGDYVNVDDLSPQGAPIKEDSSFQLGSSIGKFERDRLRRSLDKETRDNIVKDIENMAPRKLYKLKSKSGELKKKLSPMKISSYTNSPYKFRRPGHPTDYENIENVSPASLGSAFEYIKAVTPALYTDYVNVYDVSNERIGKCPIATPESLSDTIILDEPNEHSIQSKFGKTFNVALDSVRADTDSDRSLELSRTRSPINTSGINSAFKPVKSRNSSSSFSPSGESSSNWSSASENRSNNSADSGSERSCGDLKRSGQYNPLTSDISEDSSSFGWSKSGQDSVSESSYIPNQNLNYLELVGKDPFSFSMSKFPTDDTASILSKHTYSDSIPWEDSVDKSGDYQLPAEPKSVNRSATRQPLKGLENTPVFSPIYGGQSAQLANELSCRKRFMSTPKLKSNSVLSQSENSTESSYNDTPSGKESLKTNKTFNNTSTWSSQSDNSGRVLNESCFSSLSKTTYI